MKPSKKFAAGFLSVLLAFGLFAPAYAQDHGHAQQNSFKAEKAFRKSQEKLAKKQRKQAEKATKRWRKEHGVQH